MGPAAFYAKEAALRLKEKHEVVVVTYGRLPEDIPGVRIVAIDKSRPLPMRMFLFGRALMQEAASADVLYLQNGSSAEFPASIAARFARLPLVAHISDTDAHKRAHSRAAARLIERFAFSKAQAVVETMPKERPEIISFEAYPKEEMRAYEESWSAHIREIEELFSHAK
jgi:hypothetical protein